MLSSICTISNDKVWVVQELLDDGQMSCSIMCLNYSFTAWYLCGYNQRAGDVIEYPVVTDKCSTGSFSCPKNFR